MTSTAHKYIKTLMLSAALSCLIAGAAGAAVPKSSSTVTGDEITVADVFDGAEGAADRYLAPAPAPGDTMVLSEYDLARIATAFNLDWEPQGNNDKVLIRRESTEIDSHTVSAALQETFVKTLGGQKFEMELLDKDMKITLPGSADKTVAVENLSYDLSRGEFKALIAAPAGTDRPLYRKQISGRIHALIEVPMLKKSLQEGDIISAADIDFIDMRAREVSSSVITDAEKLIGQSPRRSLAALKAITMSDIVPPMLVKKGELVTMVLEYGSLQLTAKGKALDNGAEGDVVRIVNTSSNRIVQGVVTDRQTVEIQSPGAALTATLGATNG